MNGDFLDRYSRLNSPVHRLGPPVKLAGAFALVLAIVLTPLSVAWFFAILTAFLLAVAGLARLPWKFLLWRLLLLEPLVAGISLMSLFQPGGTHVFMALAIKSTLCLATMILLSSTTPFAELLRVMRRLGVPWLLVTTLALMYRYLFVLVNEAERMHRARASRTFTRQRFQLWRSLGTLLGQLFVRTSERAERIYAAMCARGWKE
jgi:cobalt/nickel transport system permease protein